MIRTLAISVLIVATLASCRSTRKIQTVVTPKDTTAVINARLKSSEDSMRFIGDVNKSIQANHIDFKTFQPKSKWITWMAMARNITLPRMYEC